MFDCTVSSIHRTGNSRHCRVSNTLLGYHEFMRSQHLLCWLIEYNTNQASDAYIPTAYIVALQGVKLKLSGFLFVESGD